MNNATASKMKLGPCEGLGEATTQASYRSYWQDDFRQSAGLPDDFFKISAQLPVINNEQQHYVPDQVRVDATGLHLTAKRVPPFTAADGKTYSYVSGEVYTSNAANAREKAFQSYGRWEVCAKMSTARGSWPAIWLLRNSPNAAPGLSLWPPEIDIMEHVGNLDEIQTNLFWGTQPNVKSAEQRHAGVPAGGVGAFHLYAVEYSPEKVDFFVDGKRIRSYASTPGSIPSEPMYLILNMAVGGVLPSYRAPCDSPKAGVNMKCADGVAAYDTGVEMVVRYVRMYH